LKTSTLNSCPIRRWWSEWTCNEIESSPKIEAFLELFIWFFL
jgi:hypothetical protein